MKLKEKKEFAENLARYSAIPTFVIDSQHKVLYWNKACEELTGIKASEVAGTDRHWKAFYDSKRLCLADMVINNKLSEQSKHYTKYGRSPYVSSGLHAETCISDPGGKKRYIVFDAAPIYNSEGELIAALQTLQDFTELKQAEQKIKCKLKIEETIAAITSMFVGPTDVDTSIESALGEVGRLCGASRSYVFLLRENEPVMDNTHEWCHEGVEPQKENLQNLPTDMYPWWMYRLHNGEIIHVPEVSSLPPEASAEKEILEMQDIRSLIVLPLYSAGELTGFIGMDNVVNTGEWKDYDISALYMVSSVVGMAMERKRAEEDLQEQILFTKSIMDTTPDLMVLKDRDDVYLEVNDAFCRFLGKRREEIIGRTDFDLFPPDEASVYRADDQAVMRTGKQQNKDESTSVEDGKRWLHVTKTAVIDASGRCTGVLCSVSDITGRKRAEEELRAAHQQLFDIIEFLPDATFVIDAEKKVIAWNRAIEDMTGVKKEDIIGKGDYAYAVPFYGKPKPMLIDLVFDYANVTEQEYDYVEKKGNSLYAEASTPSAYRGKGTHLSGKASPLFGPSGKCIGAIESIHDITERKQAEDDLKKYADELQNSNELKDLFTDILYHDLLNPAGIVKGYTEILSDMEEDEKKCQYLQIIEQNNEKLISIIERASKFAKLQSVKELKFKTMDIGVILKEVIGNFMPRIDEKQMVLEFTANGRYCANVNPVIEEVFANLLANAIKYSPQKSRIVIDITDAEEEWRVAVTDFGEGISDDDKSKLFERFRRANNEDVKGTGLGLAIVKRLITLHGGSVGVEDNPEGQGSRFWVTVKKA